MPRDMRFTDWSSLSPQAHQSAVARAVDTARLLEPKLHAYVSLNDGATATAGGAFVGMPYAAKDIFATTGRLPTCGLNHGIDVGLSGDAPVLHSLDRNGAVRIGFCTMTELAYEPSGYNTARAMARNPWNADFITGGSSSGSAVAVASGAVVFALGSDTGGSVRIPAQACGLTALKPTFGGISTAGAMALAPTLDTIGILARGAADLSAPAAVLSNNEPAQFPLRRLVVIADLLTASEAAVWRGCEAGIDAIAATGATITRRDAAAAIATIDAEALVVLQGEPARIHRACTTDPTIDPMLRKRFARGLTIDDATLAASRATRSELARHFLEQVLVDADAALLPVMPIRTPPCATCDPTSKTFDARTLYRLSQWTRFVNFLGFPALAMPTGFDDRGLPLALQIVGRPGQDLALIALAEAVQKLTDWHGRIPTGIADLVSDVGMVQ